MTTPIKTILTPRESDIGKRYIEWNLVSSSPEKIEAEGCMDATDIRFGPGRNGLDTAA
ncbi:hypothetical protein SAMN05192539_101886 [Paraburkholderia diazotrophica]|uniref:Uncharacterized protein n=2 Tax=Paraburkholderia diazotrophica TaxID=667676 RepID=A0A1H7BZZ1_9BURK|nr:hypothetical protein SAMN05192539_101886 [Paraburkholderia diazotrophica]